MSRGLFPSAETLLSWANVGVALDHFRLEWQDSGYGCPSVFGLEYSSCEVWPYVCKLSSALCARPGRRPHHQQQAWLQTLATR
eukprot:1790841-Amphidinium_carterae.1